MRDHRHRAMLLPSGPARRPASQGGRRNMDVSLERWRQQRRRVQETLQQTLTGSLCGLRKSELSAQLESLCLQLIDYVSIGHLAIYSPMPRAHQTGLLERQLLRLQAQIGHITDRVLSFNR